MKFHPTKLLKVTLVCSALILSSSCNKDSDLLAEYVIENPQSFLVNDVVVTLANNPIVISPLSNDTFEKPEKVAITEVTPPKMGTAVVNEDNTITYTPDTDKTGSDEFDYSASVTNPDNTITTETGSVTVTVTNKTPTTEEPVEMGVLKAFPGAEGFGKNTTGGRGGKVLFVTNLKDSGSGSLRAALEANGTRTVVFRVGGTISLTDPIYIKHGNLTIAGETAPGGGILIRGGMIQVEDSNVIIRYIRFRLGASTVSGDDVFSITSWNGTLENVIIDHCSLSWGDDENFNMRAGSGAAVSNVTVQNSIISECGYGILLYKNIRNVSFYQNLFAHNTERSIRANYGEEGVFKFEMVNNLIYGFGLAATNPSNGQKYTILNNKYKYSNDIGSSASDMIGASEADPGVPDSWTYAYISGNIIPSGANLNKSRVDAYIETTPFATSGLTAIAKPASSVETNILSHVGASLPTKDAVDLRIIDNYKNSKGTLTSSGSYPNIAGGTAYTDTDEDGMDDNWELGNNLDPKDSSDGQKDRNGDGYTNLEEF
ncbi:Ig-like domain-containing protein, partial [Arenibacter echinorum]